MLLKKCKRLPGIEEFVRKYFDKGEDMCNKCCIDWRDNKCDLKICEKANFDGLLFSPDYKYAYVIERYKILLTEHWINMLKRTYVVCCSCRRNNCVGKSKCWRIKPKANSRTYTYKNENRKYRKD